MGVWRASRRPRGPENPEEEGYKCLLSKDVSPVHPSPPPTPPHRPETRTACAPWGGGEGKRGAEMETRPSGVMAPCPRHPGWHCGRRANTAWPPPWFRCWPSAALAGCLLSSQAFEEDSPRPCSEPPCHPKVGGGGRGAVNRDRDRLPPGDTGSPRPPRAEPAAGPGGRGEG